MITDAHKARMEAGDVPSGRIRGIVEEYDLGGSHPDPETDGVVVVVTESDVEGVVPGATVMVRMPEPADSNFCASDLMSGFSMGGLDPVPVGGEVTFVNCSHVDGDLVEACGYALEDIVRPVPTPGMG